MFTDDSDLRARHTSLKVTLDKETCPWLEQHVVKWFEETVSHAVIVEFDRYIGVGDPEQTKKRMQQLEMRCGRQRRIRRDASLVSNASLVQKPYPSLR